MSDQAQLCRESAAALKQKYPTSAAPGLILAAVAQREKKNVAAAIAELTVRTASFAAARRG